MNNQKIEAKPDHVEESDHTQPINLVAARTPAPTSSSAPASRSHVELPKQGLTLYFRTPTPRPPGQVMTPVVGTQVSSTQHFTAKQAQDLKNSNMTSWTVIRMPPNSDIAQGGTTAANSSISSGILPSALSGGGSRHMIPAAVHPVIASGNSIIRSSHQVPPTGHIIHQPFSSHVPRGPAAVASISAAPKSAVATPILRTPHSSGTMALASSSMMALHNPVRTKSPNVTGRTATPPVGGTVVDLQKSTIGHTLPVSTTHVGLGARSIDGSVVRTGPSHSSAITLAKPISISQPIVQHLQQVYEKGTLKAVSNLSVTTSATSNVSGHQTVIPGSFSATSEGVGIVPTISRTAVSTGYSTSIMQLSSNNVGQPIQTLRATHINQSLHPLSNTTSATPHQTVTVISAKSLMTANNSIALATPSARSAVSAPSGGAVSTSIVPSTTTIPIARVYPQSSTSRAINESSQESGRSSSFQPVVSSTRAIPTNVSQNNEKQVESSSIRFTSLTKPHVATSTAYTSPSSTTYLYHDQYPANLTMHPYTTNSSTGFTTTQLRPVSLTPHQSSNSSHGAISVSNPGQSVNSVMVAVDSRHHVSLHPSYSMNSGLKSSEMTTVTSASTGNSSVCAPAPVVTTTYTSSTSNVNNHTSPRPSILRKRTVEGINPMAKKNLSSSLNSNEPISPRSDFNSNTSFTSVLPSKLNMEKSKEPSNVNTIPENQNSSLPLMSVANIKKEPGIIENVCNDINDRPIETSPRKKPRKQLLAANELMETHSSEGDENNFNMKVKVKEELDEEKTKSVSYYKRPSMSLLTTYRHSWKTRNNHFSRYSDVKPREEKKPTVHELANQKGILQQANGWKIYHLSAQMDEVIGLEENVYSRLSHLLDFVENEPPALRNRQLLNSDEDRIINKLTDLIKGNLQRSKIVQEQVAEYKQQAIKILDHKANVIEMVNKYVSRRPFKKKEKS